MEGILGLAHIGVFVGDIERSKKFYGDILGFDIVWECTLDEANGTQTKIAFAKRGTVELELVQFANPAKRPDGTVDHVAFLVDNIEKVAEDLRCKGIQFETKEIVYNSRVFPNGAKWILFRGPDNEHLELNQVL